MRKTGFFAALLSAVLFTLAVPNELFPYGNPLFGLFALTPLFYALSGCTSRRQAALIGVVFALFNTVTTYFWLLFFLDFSVWTITGVTLAHILYFWVLSQFIHRISRIKLPYRPLAVAAAWIVYEFVKSIGFLGFPYGLIAYPVNMVLPFIQTADIFGIWGIGFTMAFINAVNAELLLAGDRPYSAFKPPSLLPQGIFAGILVVLSFGYGIFAMSAPIPADKTAVLLLVQQNSNSWEDGNEMNTLLVSQRLSREGISEADKQVDMIVWSENSFRRPYLDSMDRFLLYPREDPFIPFLRDVEVPLLVGSPVFLDYQKMEAMNSVILIDTDGKALDYYGKQHLVPVAERIPFYTGLVEWFFKEVIGLPTAGWTPGDEYTIFSIPLNSGGTLSFGTPICYEDVFAYLCRNFYNSGAEILVNLTNDSWSQTVSAQTQHLVAARFRSIENRRGLVRSSNSGVSGLIDPWGRMIGIMPFFKEAYAVIEVPIYNPVKRTPYALFGDLLPIGLSVLVTAFLISIRNREKSNRKRQ